MPIETTVIIVDDQPIIGYAIEALIEREKNMTVSALAKTEQVLLGLLDRQRPDLILLDELPGITITRLIGVIVKKYPAMKIIILCERACDDLQAIRRYLTYLEEGALSCWNKNDSMETLSQTIKGVLATKEEVYVNAFTAQILRKKIVRTSPAAVGAVNISITEYEERLLHLICEDKTTKEIAPLFGRSPRTVEAAIDRLKVKIGVRTRSGLIMFAVQNGYHLPYEGNASEVKNHKAEIS